MILTTFYSNYVRLCAEKGKSASGVAKEIGLSNAAANGWKNGKEPSDVTLQKLSAYFGVPVSELTEGTKKAPTSEGEREVTDRQIKAAFFHGADMTDEEMDAAWEDVMDLRDIVIRKRKRDAGGK